MTDWSRPQEVDKVLMVFPADVSHLMPPMDEIPEEFRIGHYSNRWVMFQSRWFTHGLEGVTVSLKDDIDGEEAFAHLLCVQRSFQPKHEHKVAAVAYLASLWFNEWYLEEKEAESGD